MWSTTQEVDSVDLVVLSLQNCEKNISIVSKPPSLWCFVMVDKWTKIDKLLNAVGSNVYECVAFHSAFKNMAPVYSFWRHADLRGRSSA